MATGGKVAIKPMTRSTTRPLSICASLAAVALVALAGVPSAEAVMRSTLLKKHLCQTIGGGRFVDIPGFPGEQIDRRLLPDIAWMVRRYDIFVTDGLSDDPVHAHNGEHPIGLATDIVPDRSRGGTWGEVGDLATWAEPVQDEPRMPFRWVGWTGDAGHGRGDHLHLSWSHSPTEPGDPARIVYTRICPVPPSPLPPPPEEPTGGTTARAGNGSGGTPVPG